MAQNAPGKHYREGISLIELFDRFPNDATPEEIAQALFQRAPKAVTGHASDRRPTGEKE